jgi:hypothetical protein
VLASVGLDRYMRLHSTASRKLLAKVYCKTLPTGTVAGPADSKVLVSFAHHRMLIVSQHCTMVSPLRLTRLTAALPACIHCRPRNVSHRCLHAASTGAD